MFFRLKNNKKILFTFLLLFVFFCLYPTSVRAEDFSSNYQVEYFLQKQQSGLTSKARFTITITNNVSDVYVKKFSLSFPKSFTISNVKAADDHGNIDAPLTTDAQKTNIDLEFSDPATGRGTVNHFYLLFDQGNLFQEHGNIWEVMLPTFEDKNRTNYNILVHLPDKTDKKLSLAKPKPDNISGTTITWNNPQTKTIYAVFGDTQMYNLTLSYHLQNSQITPIYTEVAFPPDTMYQKTIITDISPQPAEIYRDEDGNLLGKYFLNPRENKEITYKGQAQLYTQPRQETLQAIRTSITNQKKYLLSQTQYWQLNNVEPITKLSSSKDIFAFTTNSLTYNYNRLTSLSSKRYGAQGILQNKDQAVCIDYSDLFIASAREKGILSREIEGYGFSQDPQLRPLSLASDILHSWPEYYDNLSQVWVQVDPTWQSTSGIDYYSSFDLNHIAFVIHGKKSDYPVPAGMYKTENSKDITVVPTDQLIAEKLDLKTELKSPDKMNDSSQEKGTLLIQNTGNTYRWDIPIRIRSNDLILSQTEYIIPILAPKEQTSLSFTYQTQPSKHVGKSQIVVYSGNQTLTQKEIVIVSIFLSIFTGYIAPGIVVCTITFLILSLRRKRTE